MQTPLQKNQQFQIQIIDIGTSGEGVGKIEDFIVFVPGTLPGDTIEVRLLKVKKSYGYGKMIKLVIPSPIRTNPKCSIANQCGGCQLQHMNYYAQLEWKTKKVRETLKRIGKLEDVLVSETLGMQHPYLYRNKAQYPIRMVDGEIQIGFYAQNSHRIVPMEKCEIQQPIHDQIRESVKQFLKEYKISIYNEEKHKGLVRHLLIKTGYHTKEVMVVLVINGKEIPHQEAFVKMLRSIPEITSIMLNHHKEKTNVILGRECTLLWGKPYLVDKIKDLSFQIAPLSFFQVNPIQTERLYEIALNFAALTGKEIVWDAYCGIGSISLFLAKKAKHVYGVEIVPEAIENARENAKRNGMTNTSFYVGKAEEVIPNCYKEGIKADVMVVDPPRKGCDQKLLETLVQMAPKRIVYVSCDVATLARDLHYLTQEGYKVDRVQPVDMFPMTTHVETVVLMCASS